MMKIVNHENVESVKPETIKPETIKPEIVQPEIIQPETVKPETFKPETSCSTTRRPGGPRTNKGKENSKYNALKHRIFAKVAVLKDEPKGVFNALLAGLREHYKPDGTLEELLVEKLAVDFWRLHRYYAGEGGEIEVGRNFIEWDERERQRAETERIASFPSGGGLITQLGNFEAFQACMDLLGDLRNSIRRNGINAANDIPILVTLYGDSPRPGWYGDLYTRYRNLRTLGRVSDGVRQDGPPSLEECKAIFLEMLNSECERVDICGSNLDEAQWKRVELELRRRSVPDSARLDQLIRYITTIERSLDRDLSQLERVQRTRLGQPIASRIEVNVSSP
jgi:hypothetical protein